ncbi:leucine-rich repeat domain-containing protein [Desulfosporosinus shakirovi]|uniref:leucine-rich repeat domain-containing protein n=1 Tax=Desulfosporosinus shakirovi TaxID=2885154 RepID=UPI001E39F6BD|nr:leucine-rich repeat domain-containing protein [Desulfosporosinus sp. SRJS8]MCB8818495.1 leucine-rich repeat domain-containing protein [Desulfosporosinus sp. SRJS8]
MRSKAMSIKRKRRQISQRRLPPFFLWSGIFLTFLLFPFFLPAGLWAAENQAGSDPAGMPEAAIPAQADSDGVLYNNGSRLKYKLGAAGVTIVECDKTATRLKVPNQIEGYPVTNIATRAFVSCEKLTEISLPATLKTIGNSAFANCLALTRMDLPEGLAAVGDGAFHNCPSLRELKIPASLASFNPNIITSCPNLHFDVAAGNLYYIGRGGVLYSKDMTTLVAARDLDGVSFAVPDTVTVVGAGAFYGSGLQSVTLGPNVKTLGEKAFSGCVQLKEALLNEGLKNIGDEGFAGTLSLKDLILPQSLVSLGWKVFMGSGLESIDLSVTQIETLPYGAFWDCASLQDITLGDRITAIEDAAFRNCTFTEITLPAGLEQVKGSFAGCAGLVSITFPYTLKQLGSAVFADCTALKAVCFEGNMPLRGDGFGTGVHNDVWTRENDSFSGLPLAVAGKLKIFVLKGAQGWEESFADFAGGSGATSRISFTYPVEYYTLDEEKAKDNPRLILHPPESLADLETGSVSEAVAVVKAGLVADAGPLLWSSSDNKVASVDISGRVTALGTGVSIITASLTYEGALYIGKAEVNVKGQETVFAWSVQRDGTAIINGFREGISEEEMYWLEIPETIAGYEVTAIKDAAFADNLNIITLTISKTVKTIGTGAFSRCIGLGQVTLSEGLEDIGASAFASTLIREVVVPQSVTRIQDYAFGNCQDLESATVKSDNLEYALGNGLFRDCRSLTEVTLAEGITQTSGYTFAGCTSLESIKLPATLQALDRYDFSGCTSLRTVELQGYLLGQETGISEKYNPFAAKEIDFVRGIDNKHIQYNYGSGSEDMVIIHPDDGNDWGSLFDAQVRTGVRTPSGDIRLDGLSGFLPSQEGTVPDVNPGDRVFSPLPVNWGSAPASNPEVEAAEDKAGDISTDSSTAGGEKESQTQEAARVFEIVKKTVVENPWLASLLAMGVLGIVILGGAGRIKKYRQSQ